MKNSACVQSSQVAFSFNGDDCRRYVCIWQLSCAHACHDDGASLRQYVRRHSSKHKHPCTACIELHVHEGAKNGLQAHRSGKSMQYRVTTPNSQAGRRYAFQFHGSSEAD